MDALVGFPRLPFIEPPQLDKATLDQMLMHVVEHGGDDLLLLTGYPAGVIWAERVWAIGTRPIFYEELRDLLNVITCSPNAALDVQRGADQDFGYPIMIGRGKTLRFRCNATACMGRGGGAGMEIVFRPGSGVPKTMDELAVPKEVQDAALPKSGIVLICGPTGSGKTTLMDSIMREQATHPQGKHILTYYQPIENDLLAIPNQTGMISQVEIGSGFGTHLPSFARAVRNSLRRHPMVIAFGEARDRETIEGAVLSSMTGHATYTTTHTPNVPMAIPRMADMFAEDRVRITNALIDNTRLIVHQRLVRRADDKGRAPVRSWLVMTQDIRSRLLKIHPDRLPGEMQGLVRECGRDLLVDAHEQFDKGLIHEDELVALMKELGDAP